MSTPIEDVYRVTLQGRAGYGDALRLTLHYRLTVAGALNSFNVLLQALRDNMMSVYMQVVHNSAVCDKITIRSYTDPVVGGDLAVSQVGGISGDPLPQQIAPQVIWYTDFIGPRYRGHNHFWYTGESKLTAGVWTSGALTEFATAADSMVVVNDELTNLIPWMQLVVLSKSLQQAEDVTSRVITQDPRNQLSRTIGRGA